MIGLVSLVWMSPQTTLTGFVTMDKGPEVLAERARTIARNLGYTDRPADEAYGYESDTDYLRYIAEHNRARDALAGSKDGPARRALVLVSPEPAPAHLCHFEH